MTTAAETAVRELKDGFAGEVLLPGGAGYDDARAIWNAMIDRRPAVIARCTTTGDVARAVRAGRKAGLRLAIRAGGHNIGGLALVDGGLVVDLSRMRHATVDAGSRRATIEAGATLAELDAATQAHGLATPVGINSTTGIAGLTLGGGFGWLSRRHGMTIDNLESAEVVTAEGEVVRASAKENADLFWGLRGGGGNFGVVTRFEYRAHPVGPEVFTGLIVYPQTEAVAVLQQYREFAAQAPDELTVWAVLRNAPPLPFLPASVHGTGVVVLALCYAGDPAKGPALVEPLRRIGTRAGEHLGVQPFAAWQQAFDPLLTAGARNYWKSHNLPRLDDGLLQEIAKAAGDLPSPHSEIFIAAVGGEMGRPSPDSAAYRHREAPFILNVHGRWETKEEDARGVAWARDFFRATARFAAGGAYVNFMTDEEGEDRIRAAYGANYDRLAQIKRTWDPGNVFSVNQNIRPA